MWHKPALLNGIANMLFGICFGVVLFMGYAAFKQSGMFPLKEVNIEGNLQHLTKEQVQLVVNKTMNGGFFTVDLANAHQAFERLAWVQEAVVRRRWPDRVDVTIKEHQPLAKWGTSAMVSENGTIFNAMVSDDLPVFIAPDARVEEVTKAYAKYKALLKTANLVIAKLELTKRNAWQLMTNSGMIIELGRANMDERMARFIRVYNSTIAGLNKQIMYVDLRYPNGFAMRKPLQQEMLVSTK